MNHINQPIKTFYISCICSHPRSGLWGYKKKHAQDKSLQAAYNPIKGYHILIYCVVFLRSSTTTVWSL